ncbi:cold-shock protein [Streptomyces sp. 147326]|uniref:cold-shock protein n=1 Tax=Streptomyces sp. 147326 TaxID=3074379 RepID=UPI00385738B2
MADYDLGAGTPSSPDKRQRPQTLSRTGIQPLPGTAVVPSRGRVLAGFRAHCCVICQRRRHPPLSRRPAAGPVSPRSSCEEAVRHKACRYGALSATGARRRALAPWTAASRPCSRPPHRQRSGGQFGFRIRPKRRAGSVSPCGVVKWFDPDRGIGLISQEGAGPDVQAEASAIREKEGRLRQGETVLFDVTLDSSGLWADNIHRPVPTRHTPRTERTR